MNNHMRKHNLMTACELGIISKEELAARLKKLDKLKSESREIVETDGRLSTHDKRLRGESGFTLLGALIALLLGAMLFARAASAGSIRTFCEEKWATDYRMVSYCIEQQTKAVTKLRAIMRPFEDISPEEAIKLPQAQMFGTCSEKWGSNFRMILYCYEQQEAAYRKLHPDYRRKTLATSASSGQATLPRGDNPELERMRRQNQSE